MKYAKVTGVLTLCVLLFCTGIYGSVIDSSCQSYDGTRGDCVPLQNCAILYQIALKADLQAADIFLIRSSKCGIVNRVHYVCCPKALNESTESTKATEISCQTPNDKPGLCEPIQGCKTLLELALKSTRTSNETSYLRNSQCGYVNGNVIACCPIVSLGAEKKPESITKNSAISTPKPCQTPNESLGHCVPILRCRSLMKLITKRDRTPQEIIFLQQSKCGNAQRRILACCPLAKAESDSESTTTERYLISQRSFIGTERTSSRLQLLNKNEEEENDMVTESFIEEENSTDVPSDSVTIPTTQQECGRININFRIFGGHETSIDEYPWTALLSYTNSNDDLDFFCGGSLINQNYILTAAHCVTEDDVQPDWQLTSVRLGEWNTRTEQDCEYDNNSKTLCAPPHRDVDVQQIIIHPQYNTQTKVHDIALLRLTEKIDYTDFISPICLPLEATTQRAESYEGATVEIAGWGATETSAYSEIKLKTNIKILSANECGVNDKRNVIKISDKQICATGYGNDSCHGDSGGPLMLPQTQSGKLSYYLIGLVSFGTGDCAQRGTRGIYTRIGAYLDWIEETIGK